MTLNLPLKNWLVRAAFLVAVLACCGWLVLVIVNQFITGTLADERLPVERERLNARFAHAEMLSIDRDLEKVILHAERATRLSPYNYEYRLLLASAQELKGDRKAAEKSLERAIQLAPA